MSFSKNKLELNSSRENKGRDLIGSEVPTSEKLVHQELEREEKQVKDVSIGAGAKIAQNLKNDPYDLDSWKDTPDSVMTIYFVFQEKLEEIKAGGMRNLNGAPEGFLQGLSVG